MKERKILLISDLHDSAFGLKKLSEWLQTQKIDLILSAGDLTSTPNPNQIESLKKIIKLLPEKIIFLGVAGNNEREETVDWMKKQKIFLKEKILFGFRFVGISGWGDKIPNNLEPFDQKTILLTHVPPRILSRGRIKIENFVHQPKIHFFGHLHGGYFVKQIGATKAIHIPSLLLGQSLIMAIPNLEIKVLS